MPHPRPNRPCLPLCAALLVAAGACQSSPQRAEEPRRVEDFVDRVEQVRSEGELADRAIARALKEFARLVTDDTSTEAVVAFGDFVAAIEHSERRAEALRRAQSRMEHAAAPVFARWERDLDAFSSARLRDHSRERMSDTRARYDALHRSISPALTRLAKLNAVLRDLALFLSHDLNRDALDALDAELLALQDEAAALSEQLRATRDAASAYIDAAALPARRTPAAPPGAAADDGTADSGR